jgi:hypothetical protein
MGRLASVVEFLRNNDQGTPTPEVKCDAGDGDPSTAGHFSPPGTDAQPLAVDVAYLGEDLGRGNEQALGYQDPKNAGVAGPGEHRIYSRASDGTIKAAIWLKADGSIVVSNDAGSVELGADGGLSIGAGQATAELGADGSISLSSGAATAELGADGSIDLSNGKGGVAVDAAGKVKFTTPLGTFGADSHMHGSPFGPTTGPIPGT